MNKCPMCHEDHSLQKAESIDDKDAQIAALMKIAEAARKAIDKTGCVTLADCASVSIAMEAYESTYGPLDAALKKEG